MVEASGGKLVTPTCRTEQGVRHLAEHNDKGSKVGAALSITSTFMSVADQMVDIFLLVAKLGLPHIMNSMPIGGLTGPYSMSALATLAHAECLFGLVLGQLVNPGVKAIHAAMPTIADVGRKDMPMRFGSRSNTLLNVLIAELNGHLGLPSCQSACGHSREILDDEAVEECRETYNIVNRFDFHIIRHMFGYQAQLNDFSIDNMEKQLELYREVKNNSSPVEDLEPAVYDAEGLELLFEGIERNDFGVSSHVVSEAFLLEGIRVEYTFHPWKEAYDLAEKGGKWDGSSMWAPTPERQRDFYFTEPITENKKVFFHLKSFPFLWDTIDDLSGLSIGAVKGYTYGEEFDSAAKAQILDVEYSEIDLRNK